MKKLRLTRSEVHIRDSDGGTELELRSSPTWLRFTHLRINDEALDVRVRRKTGEFRWGDVAWVGWSDPVGLTTGDRIYLGLGLLIGVLLRDAPPPLTEAHSAVLRIAPKGSALATPGPNNPHAFLLAVREEDVAEAVRSYLAATAERLGVEFRPVPKR
jgi:hypothetical protein